MMEESKEIIDFYKRCIRVWGEDAQIKMCIEEMSELTKELCKNYRTGKAGTEEQRLKICEEIADVINMVSQMRLMFGADTVDEFRKLKIERTQKRLDKEESEG